MFLATAAPNQLVKQAEMTILRRLMALVLPGLALVAAPARVGPQAADKSVVNGTFEQVDPSTPDRVPGWTLSPKGIEGGYQLTSVPQERGRALQIAAPANGAVEGRAALFQQVDADRWRGKRMRLSARMRVDQAGGGVTLGLRVARPAPFEVGLFDAMEDRPLGGGPWRQVAITGRVARDATTITVAITALGRAVLEVDDVRIDEAPLDRTAPSSAAAAYLEQVLAALGRHLNAGSVDWPARAAEARADIGGAVTPADTYPAIRSAIGALGDRHTRFETPGQAEKVSAATDRPLPTSRLIDGRFGLVSLPRLDTLRKADLIFAHRYADTVRTSLEAFDRVPVCGWIVDLRSNSGGNVWPMLDSLRPLAMLPPGLHDGTDPEWDLHYPRFRLAYASRPVAVLLGPDTASAGEAIALDFIGRPGIRTFGNLTAGYTTANHTTDLPDGAVLSVPASRMTDRNGRLQVGGIMPDEVAEDAEAAAVRWLGRTCAT